MILREIKKKDLSSRLWHPYMAPGMDMTRVAREQKKKKKAGQMDTQTKLGLGSLGPFAEETSKSQKFGAFII